MQRIDATNAQVEKLYGYKYMLNGKQVSTNDIDEILRESTNMNERLAAWNTSKEVGTTLKKSLTMRIKKLNYEIIGILGGDFRAK